MRKSASIKDWERMHKKATDPDQQERRKFQLAKEQRAKQKKEDTGAI